MTIVPVLGVDEYHPSQTGAYFIISDWNSPQNSYVLIDYPLMYAPLEPNCSQEET